MTDLAVWWTREADCGAIGTALGSVPQYVRDQYHSRLGRNGLGRLWVDPQFGEVVIEPWPTTPDSGRALVSGGIVIHRKDAISLANLPGIVTDLALNRLEESFPRS